MVQHSDNPSFFVQGQTNGVSSLFGSNANSTTMAAPSSHNLNSGAQQHPMSFPTLSSMNNTTHCQQTYSNANGIVNGNPLGSFNINPATFPPAVQQQGQQSSYNASKISLFKKRPREVDEISSNNPMDMDQDDELVHKMRKFDNTRPKPGAHLKVNHCQANQNCINSVLHNNGLLGQNFPQCGGSFGTNTSSTAGNNNNSNCGSVDTSAPSSSEENEESDEIETIDVTTGNFDDRMVPNTNVHGGAMMGTATGFSANANRNSRLNNAVVPDITALVHNNQHAQKQSSSPSTSSGRPTKLLSSGAGAAAGGRFVNPVIGVHETNSDSEDSCSASSAVNINNSNRHNSNNMNFHQTPFNNVSSANSSSSEEEKFIWLCEKDSQCPNEYARQYVPDANPGESANKIVPYKSPKELFDLLTPEQKQEALLSMRRMGGIPRI